MTAKELIEGVIKILSPLENPGPYGLLCQALTTLDTEKNGYVDSDKYSGLVDDYAARGIEIEQLKADNWKYKTYKDSLNASNHTIDLLTGRMEQKVDQIVQLQAENEKHKRGLEKIMTHTKLGVGTIKSIRETAGKALKETKGEQK